MARKGFTGKQPKGTQTVWDRECGKGPMLGHRIRGEGAWLKRTKNQELRGNREPSMVSPPWSSIRFEFQNANSDTGEQDKGRRARGGRLQLFRE